MVGVSGTFSNLHYPESGTGPRLVRFEFAGWVGFLFASTHEDAILWGYLRISETVVVSDRGSERDSDARGAVLLYLFSNILEFSMSFFGGPQYSDTVQPPLPPRSYNFSK